MNQKFLSPKQLLWLHSRGGRTIDDVVEIKNKYYVFMFNPTVFFKPIKIPETGDINLIMDRGYVKDPKI